MEVQARAADPKTEPDRRGGASGWGAEAPPHAGDCQGAGRAAGEDTTWELFVRHHEKTLRVWILRGLARTGMATRHEQVDDLIQDAYCRLFDRYGHDLTPLLVAREAPRSSYLRQTAWSVVRDAMRRERAVKRGWGVTVSMEIDQEARLAARYPAPDRSPEQRTLARVGYRHALKQLQGYLDRSLRGRRDLTVLLLYTLNDCSYEEIARALPGNITPSGICTLISRLRLRLRERFQNGQLAAATPARPGLGG